VLMFRSKRKTEYITPEFYKDWGNASAELESLGRRLDAVRSTIARLELHDKPADHWALRQWRENEAIILRKWKHTLRLKETGLRQKQNWDSGPKVSYDWWEGSEEPVLQFPILDAVSRWIQDSVNGNFDLTRAWEMARNESLQKARQGLG
jgi:hypothetical protein